MRQMMTTPLSERLDEQEAVARGELASLREKVASLEERLAHLAITRETLASPQGRGRVRVVGGPVSLARLPEPVIASETEPPASPGPLDLEVARESVLVLLAGANRAMEVQDIGDAIGEQADRVETARGRLKKLAKEGLVVEVSPAWFAIAPAAPRPRSENAEGEGVA
ncbi:hypothetical protein [Streptacidiphilus sp. P02-A3a]|uniref:hypothetical protein n=1 Tax=Streptacidiphilus sp. P02-A3a TaxID=2704468 RepID=UPI0015F96548|nr:hypothetical protein [Streptacidiphilus sp. P02-A3a]QMU72859.1 hypothetical protein GXP74_36065 [Streptacidiphilus sp. P02-A3a]